MAYGLSQSTILLGAVAVALMGLIQSTESATPPLSPATVAPSEIVGAVKPKELASMLRQGGLILWMRHGERDSSSGDVTDAEAAAHDCAQQSLLTQAGMTQARSVGPAIRELKLPIAAVYAARLCRTEATAELLGVGPVSKDDRLDEATTWTDRGGDAVYHKAIFAVLSTLPPKGQDVLEVTSQLTTADPQPAVLAKLGAGEVVVFQPRPDGSPALLARIGRDAWPQLVHYMVQSQ